MTKILKLFSDITYWLGCKSKLINGSSADYKKNRHEGNPFIPGAVVSSNAKRRSARPARTSDVTPTADKQHSQQQ